MSPNSRTRPSGRRAGKQIVQMLIDGELDAVLGEKSDHPDLKPLFADVAAEEKAWFAKHKVVPINHMVVVSRTLSDQHPDVVREVHRLLAESAAASSAAPRFHRGRDAALAGADHRLFRAAEAHSACVRGRRAVRRRDAGAVIVGWAKAHCAVPSMWFELVGTLRFAHPTRENANDIQSRSSISPISATWNC